MKRILLVEDSNVVKNLTRNILEAQGFVVDAVKDGTEVLEVLGSQDFDIILMDMHMPVMGGLECTQSIRALKDEKKRNIPIIAFTGNVMGYTQEEYLAQGINDVVIKPVDYGDLLRRILSLVSLKS
ncbi:MAG: response regulator [Cytophagales bacterium]|nr:response regulator [Cytophagales bacterium]